MADLTDLQREWDAQPEYSEEKMNQIAGLVRTRSDSMRSVLFARDKCEAGACVFIIVVFSAYWFCSPNAIAKTGCVITVAGAVEIMALMWAVQRRSRVDFTSVPLKEFLLSEVQGLNRQISLLRHVVWWYVLPLYVGTCLFAIGIGLQDDWASGRVFSISFCVANFLLGAFLWWFNQSARKKTLEPLRDAMQQTYDGLSALDADPAAGESDLVHALADPALDRKCCGSVRLVSPTWHQTVVIGFACMGGAFVGVLIQQLSGEPMRYGEWPLVGLMVAGLFAIGSTCVRRVGKNE